jgi:hypothetical protein
LFFVQLQARKCQIERGEISYNYLETDMEDKSLSSAPKEPTVVIQLHHSFDAVNILTHSWSISPRKKWSRRPRKML